MEQHKYQKVIERITRALAEGRLSAGDKVWSLRKICAEEQVSMITAKHAYQVLEQQQILSAEPQKGYFVSAKTKIEEPEAFEADLSLTKKELATELKIIELLCRRAFRGELLPTAAAVPHARLLPLPMLRRITSRVTRRSTQSFSRYSDPFGISLLRESIAKHYRGKGIACSASDIVIHGGALEAITTSLRSVTKPGDSIIIEQPSYYILFHAAALLGLRVQTVRHIPNRGIDLIALEKTLKTKCIKAVVVIPNFHNPVGTLMSDNAKEKLVSLCASYRTLIIEDDVYAELSYKDKRPLPLLSFDKKGLVIHCSSVTKTLAPGLRVGWSISKTFRDAIEHNRLFSQVTAPTLTQEIVAEFFISENFSKHCKKLSAALRQQRDFYRARISEYFPKGTKISNPEGGFLLWIELPKKYNTTALFESGNNSFAPGIVFGGGMKAKNFMRISYGTPFTDEIERYLEQTGRALLRGGNK